MCGHRHAERVKQPLKMRAAANEPYWKGGNVEHLPSPTRGHRGVLGRYRARTRYAYGRRSCRMGHSREILHLGW